MFAPRDSQEGESLPAVVAPRASAKPTPRDYSELFAGDEEDDVASPGKARRERSVSPAKSIAPKGGAGKNYQPSRLFENDENSPAPKPNQRESMYRPNPKKFNHFDFDDGSNPQETPIFHQSRQGKAKGASQWDFDSFNTPEKPKPKNLPQQVRHWGTDDDVVEQTPLGQPKQDKPRKDAETHFEFIDDGTPEVSRRMIGRPRGTGMNNGLGLYENNLYDSDGTPGNKTLDEKPASGIVPTKDRSKDFEPHFELTDKVAPVNENKKVPEDQAKHVKMMEKSWQSYDASPGPNQKENARPTPAALSETTNALKNRNNNQNKGISTAGDGMGGKKGSGRQWGFGDDSDGEEHNRLNSSNGAFMSGKRQGNASQTASGGGFWDF